jgi:predicted amidophosphoribosyltransferase
MKLMTEPTECPKCGEWFDNTQDNVIVCPVCGIEGSTACCNSGGVGCPCIQCEEEEA